MVNIGEQAPDFALPNQDGKVIRLGDLRGKKVVIFAFPQANTAGCTIQACAFRDDFPQIEAENAVVLGISTDGQKALKSWKQNRKLPYDLLSDPDHAVLDQLNAFGMSLFGLINIPRTTRSYWVIDENGVIIDGQVGVGPKESAEKALATLKRFQTART